MEFEPHDQYLQRLKKLSEIVEKGHVAYPTRFAWTHTAAEILEKYGSKTAEELAAQPVEARVAGRLVQMRGHGKAGFAHLLNRGSRLQIYVKLDVVGERAYELYRLLDLGDSIGVRMSAAAMCSGNVALSMMSLLAGWSSSSGPPQNGQNSASDWCAVTSCAVTSARIDP